MKWDVNLRNEEWRVLNSFCELTANKADISNKVDWIRFDDFKYRYDEKETDTDGKNMRTKQLHMNFMETELFFKIYKFFPLFLDYLDDFDILL